MGPQAHQLVLLSHLTLADETDTADDFREISQVESVMRLSGRRLHVYLDLLVD